MTGIGIGLVAAGVTPMAVGSEEDPFSDDLVIDWKVTGSIWTAAGALLTVVGLTRRE